MRNNIKDCQAEIRFPTSVDAVNDSFGYAVPFDHFRMKPVITGGSYIQGNPVFKPFEIFYTEFL